MKWYRNKEMLQDILEQNKNELEKYKHDKIVALLKDESNLIQDHLVLLDEKEKLKNDLEFMFKHFSIPPKCFIYEEKRKVYYYEEFSDYIEFTLEQFETYKTIWNKLKEVMNNEV